jgi:hypothetical protein
MKKEITDLFEHLSEEADVIPARFCEKRAGALATAMINSGETAEKVKILVIETKTGEPVISKIRDIDWRYHYAVSLDGKIYDPILGKPVSEKEYLNTAFVNTTELQITELMPCGIKKLYLK